MRNIVFRLSGLLVVLTFLMACNTEKKHTASDEKYTCPMHPQIVSDAPGTCPICAMDLVPVNDQGGKNELMLSASQAQLANIRTMKVGEGKFSASKLLNARLVANPEQTAVISSRYPGRIEKLFVKETGRVLQKGEALLQIYSEELQTLQQDYLLQVKQMNAFPDEPVYRDLLKTAQNRLMLYGYTPAQINALAKAKKALPLITVYAKEGGVVNEINVTEGSYVAEGSPLVRLENFGSLWVEADAYPAEAGTIKEGTSVKVRIAGLPDEHSMKIDYIAPEMAGGSQIVKVRGTISNSKGTLQPGMQATVLLPSATVTNAVRLPLDAVIRKEDGAHVWIKTGKDTFAARNITTGAEDFEQIVATSGLKGGDEVVISGGYLLYSEFILKKGTDPTSAHKH